MVINPSKASEKNISDLRSKTEEIGTGLPETVIQGVKSPSKSNS